MANLVALQETLKVSFSDLSLLEQAMIHSSYLNENLGFALGSNERLEFLGDAVLGFIVAQTLYQDFPDLAEGEMTKLRSALVSRDTLARVASVIRLGDYLYLGRGEEASGGRHKPANLVGALEAVVAAVCLDLGLAITRELVLRLLDEELRKMAKQGRGFDYKSQLQELIQSRYRSIPDYRLIETTGPDHDKKFTVEVWTGNMLLGRGLGKSKKMAETEAARVVLEQLPTNFTQ